MKKELTYKYSKQREALFNLLCSTNTHPTAAWLYDELRKEFPHLSQGTVYRNLNILAEQKRIKILNTGTGFAHFDADTTLHNHVICTQCGKVEDVCMPPDVLQERQAAEMSGYRINSHRLDFFGVCPECLRRQNDGIPYGEHRDNEV
ncbi:MAG: transcriptional repressor [Treponema sp.]